MKIFERYKWLWLGAHLLLSVLLILCVSCSSDDEDEPTLNIYVYAPERPMITRAEVVPTEDEGKIHNLQIWVFRSSDPSKMVASLTLTNEAELQGLNENKSAAYSIALTDRSFAEKPEPVDIYVLANVLLENNGSATYSSITSSATLDEALFNGGHFYDFWTDENHQALTKIPEGKGVPMSGVARNRSVTDKNNVLHINDANLKLLRTVSKIRFVFSSLDSEGINKLYIDGVTLNTGMMYQSVRFFLDNEHPNYWVEGSVSSWPVALLEGDPVNPVKQNGDPTAYAITSTMTDTEYETLIQNGLTADELTERGPVYLPESDKRLMGTIKYHLGKNGPQLSASFSMVNGDFRRNQTWIVYAYYTGSSKLEVNAVKVTDWSKGSDWDHWIHNW